MRRHVIKFILMYRIHLVTYSRWIYLFLVYTDVGNIPDLRNLSDEIFIEKLLRIEKIYIFWNLR